MTAVTHDGFRSEGFDALEAIDWLLKALRKRLSLVRVGSKLVSDPTEFLRSQCTVWEQLCDIDEKFRAHAFENQRDHSDLQRKFDDLLRELDVVARETRELLAATKWFVSIDAEVEASFRRMAMELSAAATPDREYFTNLGELESAAVEEHRNGGTVEYDCQ